MSNPPITGPINEPHADQYKPRTLRDRDDDTMAPKSHDVIAAQELLDWMRFRGFRAATVVVGAVQIVGLVDDYARRPNSPDRPPDDPTETHGWGG